MPKLVTKFKFIPPGRKAGSYARYIATREGVEKIETPKTYADYIATRPRAERFGSHGLFTDDGVGVKLRKVSEELNGYEGNIYTAILSLRREDAQRLGFDNGTRWRDLLRGQTQALAENLKIPLAHLRWYAAFHNEGHHPHVHLIAYSAVPNEGYLSQQGVEKLRSALARDIFSQDLVQVYRQQTEYRDELRQTAKAKTAELLEKINHDRCENPAVEAMLRKLSAELKVISGKKVYGYLPPETKKLVDTVVEELAKDERIQRLYDLWYTCREEILKTYTQDLPPRISLADCPEFKSIKNAVIRAAMELTPPVPEEENATQTVCLPPEMKNLYIPEKPTAKAPPMYPASLRLLRQLAQLLQTGIRQDKQRSQRTDRKLKRKIDEKKQAQGIRLE